MIKTAFCDSDPSVLNDLCALGEKYRTVRNQEIVCAAFRSPLDLLAEIGKGVRFDILFLDPVMPNSVGIGIASEIRSYDNHVKIIFLAASAEYALQSYTVGAFSYHLKPMDTENFFRLMDAAVADCRQEQSDSLILRCRSGITRIQLRHLEYCEVIHRTLLLHLTNGRVLESSGSLEELSRHLMLYGNIIRPHRSYLVNLEHVNHISYKAVTMSCGTEIPIPRGKYRELKDAYLEYALQKGFFVL